MVGQITGKMFDQSIEKDCVSDLSGPASCRIGPVRQVAGPESAAIQNLAAMHNAEQSGDQPIFQYKLYRRLLISKLDKAWLKECCTIVANGTHYDTHHDTHANSSTTIVYSE